MGNGINRSHDRGGQGRSSYQHDIPYLYDNTPEPHDFTKEEDIDWSDISGADNLYESFLRSKKNSSWKRPVQQFEMFWARRINKIQTQLRNRTWKPGRPTEFVIAERGRSRVIHGEPIGDRVVEHALNDIVVMPAIKPYLIYDNGASMEGKGVDFTRRRLVAHLRKFYNNNGNDGYVLLIDFSKYYDNIQHEKLLEQFREHIDNDMALWLIERIVGKFEVDVSYMSEEEYASCMDKVFNSMDYLDISPDLLTGEKFMKKHLDIGNQTSQSAGILYPTPLDNYIKTVRGVKYYGRYMDDAYVIHHSKEFLQDLLKDIVAKAEEIGMIVNTKKTRIVKVSNRWRFLQIQYQLTDSGKIIRRINPKRLIAQRRKMKKLVHKLPEKDYHDWFFAWLNSHKKYMNRQQVKEIVALYYDLGGK